MNVFNKSVIFFILVFVHSLLSAAEVRRLYKINPADKHLLNRIERSGGVIDSYIPGKSVTAYLTPDFAYTIQTGPYEVSITEDELNIDSLSSDHIIGSSYHSYDAVTFILDSLTTLYSEISYDTSLGLTVEGRDMWAVCITDNPGIEEPEPEVKYVANMHGDELLSQELMLFLIEYLVEGYYSGDSRIMHLIDETEIWIVPNMNFDGSQILERFNADSVDLNRNFPDRDPGYINPEPIQAETRNIIDWSQSHSFVLSANFHSGKLVVNYPWDKNLDGSDNYAATPDDETFIRLALTYAKQNTSMYNSETFPNGITNGAQWYNLAGGMMDWNYHSLSCMDLTVELANTKIPDADSLMHFWDENRESMISLLEQVHTGLHGTVKDSLTDNPIPATITVSEIGKAIYNDPDPGDYYRLLEPGRYQVLVESDGYYPRIFNDVQIDSGASKELNIHLEPVIYHTISGTITDSITDGPLSDTKIFFYKNKMINDSALTDLSGTYSVRLPAGEYKMLVQREGYFDKQLAIDLTDNIVRDIRLFHIIPGTISGSVTVQNGGYTGAVVSCQHISDTLSGTNFFRFDSLTPGDVTIFAWKFGNKTTIIDSILDNGGELTLNIFISPGDNNYFTDFEEQDEYFGGAGDWQRGSVTYGPPNAYSGNFAWATNPAGNYTSGPFVHFLETRVFSLQGMAIPVLEFYQWYDIENNYDGGNIKVSNDGGDTWQLLVPRPYYDLEMLSDEYDNPLAGEPVFTGSSGNWNKISIDLQEYMLWPFVMFRFELGVDGHKNSAGWYLDNFNLFDANATGFTSQNIQLNRDRIQVNMYPNPANPSTNFNIFTSKKGLITIKIFDIRGKLIHKHTINAIADQTMSWRWHGINLFSRPVASGIYFANIASDGFSITKKIILIR